MDYLARFRLGRWIVWGLFYVLGRPLSVTHAAWWMRIPEHSVEQVLDDGVLESLHPKDVLKTARRMDRQRHEHDQRHRKGR